jgi:replicative DNA helicase
MSTQQQSPNPQQAPKWRHVSEIRKETLSYINKRKHGLIRSIKTPWAKLNGVMLDGLEWGGVYVIAGRPGTGKTAVVSQITNYAHYNNPDQDFAILNFQFEMSDRSIGARELTKPMNMEMAQLFSAKPGTYLSQQDMDNIQKYHEARKNDDIYYVTDPLTATDFRKEVIKFYQSVKKPIIVTIDHSVLTKRSTDEQSQIDTLYALSTELVYLKKRIPDSMYIILSQMNRTIEDPKRKENGVVGNYPTASDIFGADALMQNADVTIAMNRPDVLGISQYGPEKLKVHNGMMVFHLIKNRYGEQCMLLFDQDLKHFEVKEGAAPAFGSAKKQVLSTKP